MKGLIIKSNMINLFVNNFLIQTAILSICGLVILFFKRGLKNNISAKGHYKIWWFFLITLILPFIPKQLLTSFNFNLPLLNNLNLNYSNPEYEHNLKPLFSNINYNSNWSQNFSISTTSSAQYLSLIFLIIWILGVIIFTMILFYTNYKLDFIKKFIKPLNNKKIENLYNDIISEMNIVKKPLLGKSHKVASPITLGLFKPYIILPNDTITEFSNDEIKYILLHELTHYKNKDILINYIVCLFQVLYWFNPIIWFLFKELKTDMEIACDIAVLKVLNESNYIDYGKTIINFASKISELPTLSPSSGISGSKKQIKKRIQKISAFKTENKTFILKSTFIYLIIGLFTLTQIPLISAAAANDKNVYSFNDNQVIYEDLSYYFPDLSGSFVLYDLNSKQYSIYNEKKSVLRVSPNSTYKIFSGLLGLEQGVIKNEYNTLYWNGTNYPYDAWNKDQNLNSAMQSSVNWYFQEIDKQIGMKDLQNYFKKINYGNYNISAGIDNYWIESSLKISPVEQVQLLKSFYLNEYNFKAENIKTIKNSIKISEKSNSTMYGKTGTGTVNNKNINGWFIGFIEKNDNTYFFATNIQGIDNANGSTAAEITQKILEQKNIY